MNFKKRRSQNEDSDESFVISDSDEVENSYESRPKKTDLSRNLKNSEVIAESDSESVKSSGNDLVTDDEDSEEEDLRFMDASHRVSIQVDSDSETKSDSTEKNKFLINKKKRRSIYDTPSRSTPHKSESTPINFSALRKKKKPNTPLLESSKDFVQRSKGNFKKKPLVFSEDEDEDDHNDDNERDSEEDDNDDEDDDSDDYGNYHGHKKLSIHRVNKSHISEGKSKSFNKSNQLLLNKSKNKSSIEENNESELITISTSSESEVDQQAIQLAKKEIGVGNIDFLEAQKREHLLLQMAHVHDQIKKLETFTVTIDLSKLPDQGAKVIDTLNEQKKKMFKLKEELDKLNGSSSFKGVYLTPKTKLEAKPTNKLTSTPRSVTPRSVTPRSVTPRSVTPQRNLHSEKREKFTSTPRSITPRKKTDLMKPEIFDLTVSSSDDNKENVQNNKVPKNFNSRRKITIETSSDESDPKVPVRSIKKRNSYSISSDDSHENLKQNIKKIDLERKSQNISPKSKNQFVDFANIPKVPLTSFAVDDLGKKALETLNKQQTLTHKRLEQLHGSLTTRPSENDKAKDPYGLNIPLMDHQKHGLAWMLWREKQKPKGGILADDMGLGKTLSMISLILAKINEKRDSEDSNSDSSGDEWYSKKKHKRYYGGTLIICPASLIKQWESEVKNRCKRGLLTVLVFHGNNRFVDDRRLSKFSMVVTTYQTVVREAQAETGFYKMEWDRIILDEAHYIRNHKSKACESVCGLSAKYKWALTGTPIQNKEMDLYAILKFLKCSPFDDLPVWKRWVDNKNEAGKQRLITIMKSIMLRRTKQELIAKGTVESLPEKEIQMIEINLDREENLVYQKILLFSQNLFAQFLAQRAEKQHMRDMYGVSYSGKNTHFTKAQKLLLDHHSKTIETHEILVLLLRLRQMCCHPALIHAMLDREDVENNGLQEEDLNVDLLQKLQNMSINEDEVVDEHAASYKIDEKVAANLLTSKNPVFKDERESSKVRAIMETVDDILEKGDKLIIVSQWSSFLKVIARNLDDYDNARYAMFTGEVAVKHRQGIVDELNDPNGNLKILLLSLTAGGVGLNLVGANHLLLIDIHWNPQLEQQAQDRIYRFGQKKDVFIYKFICKETIEERVKALQDKKLSLAQDVLTGSRTISSKLTIEDLKSLFS